MIQCKYCYGTNGIKSKHRLSCPFNPKNNKKIISYLENVAISDSEFLIYKYNEFASKNKLPVSLTLHSLFLKNGWVTKDAKVYDTFLYLIYRSYELNLISDLEKLDLITYKITFGTFGLSNVEYLKRSQQISLKSGVSLDSILNSYLLLYNKVMEGENC